MEAMTKTFENGVLTVTRKDGAVLTQALHPERYEEWTSEAEAMAFKFDNRYHFIMPEPNVETPTQP
jgi:hypothetical protein|tara:strand:- start:1421 stop:1618 length:198 start_codon:yes stop_codon:yes gene_type:complete